MEKLNNRKIFNLTVEQWIESELAKVNLKDELGMECYKETVEYYTEHGANMFYDLLEQAFERGEYITRDTVESLPDNLIFHFNKHYSWRNNNRVEPYGIKPFDGRMRIL